MPLPAFDPRALDTCRLGETTGDLALTSRDDNRQAAAWLVAQAVRVIDLFSPDLEPVLYDQTAVIDAMTQLSLSSPRARIRVLVKDPERIIKDGHRIVELSRRLSSYIEIRKVHADYQDNNESFLLCDNYGLLHRRHAPRFEGVFSCKAPLEVRRLRAFLDEVWGRSEPVTDLRRLHI